MGSSAVPGIVIDHVPASTQRYIGSPSIVILPDGSYLASHDIFGPGSTYDTTRVFRSRDRGGSWQQVTEIKGQFWSNLFLHRGAVYLMGANRRFGSVIIRRSQDGGATWTDPRDADCGLLLGDGMYHTAPMPVVEQRGRLWRAMEDMHPEAKWGVNFRAFMMSAPADADLLRAASWTSSNRLRVDQRWLDGRFGGWLEGNAVVDPDGNVVDVLRADYRVGDRELAAIVRIDPSGRRASFDPERDFVELPGGCKKFTIRFDGESRLYWTLSNIMTPESRGYNVERTRNTLALLSSPDLRAWSVGAIVLHHPDLDKHAFQYVDWQFDGADIVVASRTAFDDGLGGAHNQHDANYMTFHRVQEFRQRGGGQPRP